MFVRTVKVPSSSGTVNEYVRIVESYRESGKVKQRTIADLGRKDVLASVPRKWSVPLPSPGCARQPRPKARKRECSD